MLELYIRKDKKLKNILCYCNLAKVCCESGTIRGPQCVGMNVHTVVWHSNSFKDPLAQRCYNILEMAYEFINTYFMCPVSQSLSQSLSQSQSRYSHSAHLVYVAQPFVSPRAGRRRKNETVEPKRQLARQDSGRRRG